MTPAVVTVSQCHMINTPRTDSNDSITVLYSGAQSGTGYFEVQSKSSVCLKTGPNVDGGEGRTANLRITGRGRHDRPSKLKLATCHKVSVAENYVAAMTG